MGRTVQWATMLSPWNLTIIRCTKVPNFIPALLASSLTDYKDFDEVLENISPSKILSLLMVLLEQKLLMLVLIQPFYGNYLIGI